MSRIMRDNQLDEAAIHPSEPKQRDLALAMHETLTSVDAQP
ncbi:MAG: hypothetical protein ACOVQH_10235 [Burkholderiaceae bacterium]